MRFDLVQDWQVERANGEYRLQVDMEYEPTVSKNSSHTRDGFLKSRCRNWMDQLAWVIRACINSDNVTPEPPLELTISGTYIGKGRPADTQNWVDSVADAVEEGTGINDRFYKVDTKPMEKGEEAKITVAIKVKEARHD
jgi:hypothetical protein